MTRKDVRPCSRCGRPMRMSHATSADTPGVVRHAAHGLCRRCWEADQRGRVGETPERQCVRCGIRGHVSPRRKADLCDDCYEFVRSEHALGKWMSGAERNAA